MNELVESKKRLKIKIIGYIALLITFLWFSLTLFEMYRVKDNNKPIICFNQIKDIEDDDEYSIMCYGILYKYKEYHYKKNDVISAREFTLFFTEFNRNNE